MNNLPLYIEFTRSEAGFIGMNPVGKYCPRAVLGRLTFQKLGIPVRRVDGIKKWCPFLIARKAEGFLHEGCPLGADRKASQEHAGLMRCAPALAAIALMAGADHVLPNGYAALRTGDDVIEIEFLARQSPVAVLAGQFVARIDIKTAEANLAFGHSVVGHQKNHPGHANDPIDHTDGLVMG